MNYCHNFSPKSKLLQQRIPSTPQNLIFHINLIHGTNDVNIVHISSSLLLSPVLLDVPLMLTELYHKENTLEFNVPIFHLNIINVTNQLKGSTILDNTFCVSNPVSGMLRYSSYADRSYNNIFTNLEDPSSPPPGQLTLNKIHITVTCDGICC